MEEFMRKFTQLNGESAKVVLEHILFDRQVFYCDELQTINDNKRAGLVLKGHEVFVYKPQIKLAIVRDNLYKLHDGRMTLTVIVNEL